jgi:hypothetical protein
MGRTPRRLPPRTSCTGPVSTCFVPGLPRHPADTLALDQRPRGPGGQAEALGCGARRASQARPAPRRPSRETRCRQATTPPADTGHVDRLCPTGVARHTEPLRGSARRGQRGGSAADTGGCPSGHLHASVRTPGCTGRVDTGRVDAGRPLDRLDGHSHGGTGVADRATTGLAGVGTSWRPVSTRWAPDLAGSRHLGPLGHARRLCGDGHLRRGPDRRHGTAAPAPPGMRPRPGALLSCVGIWIVRGEGNGTTEGEGVLGQACKGVLMGCRDSR